MPGSPALQQAPAPEHEGAGPKFWRILTRFDSGKLQPYMALRNAAGLALPLIAGYALGMPRGGLAVAIGALNVSYSDGSDPYAERAKRMLRAGALCALAVFAGAMSGRNHLVAAVIACAWSFLAGMVVSISTTAGDLGVISTVSLLVYAAQPLTARQAAYSGLLALAGGLLQTGLSIAMWPVRRYEPERRALAAFYSELARSTEVPAQTATSLPVALSNVAAETALSSLGRDTNVEGLRYRSLLSQAERLQLGLLTLSRLRVRLERESPAHPCVETLRRYFLEAGKMLQSIADSLLIGKPVEAAGPALTELETTTKKFSDAGAVLPVSFLSAVVREARYQMAALNGQLRSATRLANYATPLGEREFARLEAVQPWWLKFQGGLATLRANLNLHSSAFRHAVRLAICVAIGDLLGRGFDWQRSYWLPMTVVIVLKPDFTSTFTRGVLRIAGTVAGLFLATGLLRFLPHTPEFLIAQIVVFTFLLRWVGTANYGIFAVAVSALIVQLVTILGIAPGVVIWARGINTVAGGCVALVAYWLWPTWERAGVSEQIAAVLDAYREYFDVLTQAYVTSGDKGGVNVILRESPDLDAKRLATRRARSNLEASVDRVTAEPGTTAEQMNRLNAMLASSQRFLNAVMALEAGWLHLPPVRPRPQFALFKADVEKTLNLLAKMLRGTRVRAHEFPKLREGQERLAQAGDAKAEQYALVNVETDRITNSLNTLGEQVTEWARAQKLS
ncbi:MAG: FUSC family protein [Candidatus Acidiferrum sp.]